MITLNLDKYSRFTNLLWQQEQQERTVVIRMYSADRAAALFRQHIAWTSSSTIGTSSSSQVTGAVAAGTLPLQLQLSRRRQPFHNRRSLSSHHPTFLLIPSPILVDAPASEPDKNPRAAAPALPPITTCPSRLGSPFPPVATLLAAEPVSTNVVASTTRHGHTWSEHQSPWVRRRGFGCSRLGELSSWVS